jgi:hypothetical protein
MRLFLSLVSIFGLFWSCTPGGNTPGSGGAPLPGFDSTSVKPAAAAQIRQMPFEGELIQAISWTDKAGKNTLVFSGKPAYPIDADMRRAEFFAYAYAEGEKDSLALLWQIREAVDSCYCDCAVELTGSPVILRDMDQDGYAEASFMYFLNDLCDASPMDTKLIVASRNQTFFMEGYTRRFLAPGESFFQKISTSENFDQASPPIREFARLHWESYLQSEQTAFENVQKENNQTED